MKRHRPKKSRPPIARGQRVPAGTEFTVSGSSRMFWLHPTKGWRSQRAKP